MLRGVDYKDNDKILTLYSLERGKISAGVRGVKKSGAKLSFCAAPFCFAEYVLSEKGERLSVIGATEIESFYKLRLNVFAYCAGSAIAEFLLKFTEEGQPEPELFSLVLSALKAMCFEEKQPSAVLISFLCSALQKSGYGMNFCKCGGCKSKNIGERPFFDFSAGKFYCEACKSEQSVRILPQTAAALRACAPILAENSAEIDTKNKVGGFYASEICGADVSEYLKNEQDKILAEMRALSFLNHYLSVKQGEKLKSLTEYAKLVNFA